MVFNSRCACHVAEFSYDQYHRRALLNYRHAAPHLFCISGVVFISQSSQHIISRSFNEGAVERAHAEDNKGNRTWCANIASPEARNEAKNSAKSQSSIAAVVEITDATAAGLKRNFGEISKGKRAVKIAEAVIDKQQKLVKLDAL